MVSLKPKEGGGYIQPPNPRKQGIWIPIVLVGAVIAIGVVAYGQYSAKAALEERIAVLESQMQGHVMRLQKGANDLASDLNVVTERIGVTGKELAASRKFAERLRLEQEEAKDQLATELATKASTTDVTQVAANVAAAREEAASKVAEVQKATAAADTRIASVSGDVKVVATNLEATKLDLAESKRTLVDVRTTLSEQIARNSGELAALKLKGERNFLEFDIKKGKKNEMQRVGDIRLELRDTDTKKQKYNIVIQVDDNKLEKKDRVANEPVQFLVGRDGLRYEIVVNYVDKDRVRGYLSTPKDKALSAERPQLRD